MRSVDLARLEALLGVKAGSDPSARLEAVAAGVRAAVERANEAKPRPWCAGCPLRCPPPTAALDTTFGRLVAAQWLLDWTKAGCVAARRAGEEGAACRLLQLQRRLVAAAAQRRAGELQDAGDAGEKEGKKACRCSEKKNGKRSRRSDARRCSRTSRRRLRRPATRRRGS